MGKLALAKVFSGVNEPEESHLCHGLALSLHFLQVLLVCGCDQGCKCRLSAQGLHSLEHLWVSSQQGLKEEHALDLGQSDWCKDNA